MAVLIAVAPGITITAAITCPAAKFLDLWGDPWTRSRAAGLEIGEGGGWQLLWLQEPQQLTLLLPNSSSAGHMTQSCTSYLAFHLALGALNFLGQGLSFYSACTVPSIMAPWSKTGAPRLYCCRTESSFFSRKDQFPQCQEHRVVIYWVTFIRK